MPATCVDCHRDIPSSEDPTDGRCLSCDAKYLADRAASRAAARDEATRFPPASGLENR